MKCSEKSIKVNSRSDSCNLVTFLCWTTQGQQWRTADKRNRTLYMYDLEWRNSRSFLYQHWMYTGELYRRDLYLYGRDLYGRDLYLYGRDLYLYGRDLYGRNLYLYGRDLYLYGRDLYLYGGDLYLYIGDLYLYGRDLYLLYSGVIYVHNKDCHYLRIFKWKTH